MRRNQPARGDAAQDARAARNSASTADPELTLSLVHLDRLIPAFGIVFVLEPVLQDLGWSTSPSRNLPPARQTGKKLGHTLIKKFGQALRKLLGPHRVGIVHVAEVFGRKTRDTPVVQDLSRCQGIPQLEIPAVRQADDVPGEGLVHDLLLVRQKSVRTGEAKRRSSRTW